MKRSLLATLLGTAAFVAPLHAVGAVISATYHPLTGQQWTVDFTVTGDGSPSVISDFTVYFPVASFTALALGASPSAWDSLVVQPDANLQSAGFLDSLALGGGIGNGASVGGFDVRFTFLGAGNPPPLRFDINDANFHAVYSGLTTAAVAAIPEPETVWLMLLGLGAIAGARLRQRRSPLGLEIAA